MHLHISEGSNDILPRHTLVQQWSNTMVTFLALRLRWSMATSEQIDAWLNFQYWKYPRL